MLQCVSVDGILGTHTLDSRFFALAHRSLQRSLLYGKRHDISHNIFDIVTDYLQRQQEMKTEQNEIKSTEFVYVDRSLLIVSHRY